MDEHSANNPQPPFVPYSYKSKPLACLLALLIPGAGHMYVGLMQKGFMLMILVILDICMIGANFTDKNDVSTIEIFFTLMLPAIYFYNMFDALQSAEKVNARIAYLAYGSTDDEHTRQWLHEQIENPIIGKHFGLLLIAGGVMILLFINKPQWLIEFFSGRGSYLGAVVLIVSGIFLYVRKNNKQG